MKAIQFLSELSTELLARYKKAAYDDARKADSEGDYERGNKRYKGINKATIKQFDNDLKKHGQLAEKSTTEKQARFMAAAAHDPQFAARAGIKQSVAKEFNKADTGTKQLSNAMKHKPKKKKGVTEGWFDSKPKVDFKARAKELFAKGLTEQQVLQQLIKEGCPPNQAAVFVQGAQMESIAEWLAEHGKASRSLCTSSKPDDELGASQLASCKSQGLRARDGEKSHLIGHRGSKVRITVGGKKIKGKKYGGPLPDYGTRKGQL